jgi:hypothetical protein
MDRNSPTTLSLLDPVEKLGYRIDLVIMGAVGKGLQFFAKRI